MTRSRHAEREGGSYRRRWLLIGALGALLVLLFGGIVVAGARTWIAYNETFGARTADEDWLHREFASYSVDVSNELLAVRRLEIHCLRFAAKISSKEEFNLHRRQVASTLTDFGPGSILERFVAAHASFPPAYEAVQRFQKAAEGLEMGEVSIDEAYARGEEAATAWGKLTVEAQDKDYAARDGMEKSIVEFRPLAVRTFILTSVLMGLCILAFVVAAYATARALQAERLRFQAERLRFDRFELLLATVGHDLRSPLLALVGAAKLAAADTLPSERDKFVRIVHERSAFFTRLLDDLVDLARSESLSFVATSLDLSTWFETAASRYRQAVEAKQLTFNASLAAPVPRIVFDPHRLTQCADNLVFNAVRYTEQGSVSFVVRCEPGAQLGAECKLTIEVTDTGRGIAVADQARIFEPFVRVDSAVKGMGVGLSMVASLARRVGGAVAVRSALGQGSTFTFTAPVAADDSPSSGNASESPADREKVATGGGASRAVVPRVLVVDDDEHITQVVGGLLPHMGFAADVAIGGQAGLALAKQNSYCAVLTDIQMSDLDGFELAEALRASLDPCPMLIAMTAYTAKPAADERSRVFDAMLRKPFDEDELGELLDKAATRWGALLL